MYSNILDNANLLDLLYLSAWARESVRDLAGDVSSRSHLYADPASINLFENSFNKITKR